MSPFWLGVLCAPFIYTALIGLISYTMFTGMVRKGRP